MILNFEDSHSRHRRADSMGGCSRAASSCKRCARPRFSLPIYLYPSGGRP
jgi:hypothetical protein